MNRRALAWLLLALFACQMAAFWVVPFAQLMQAQALAAAKIREREGLAEFHFSRKHFEAVRVGQREFQHDGMMHDIAELHHLPGDSVRVVARPDAHEQELLHQFARAFRPEAGSLPADNGGAFSKMLARFLAEHFLAPVPLARWAAAGLPPAKRVFSLLEMPPGIVLDCPSPPPKA